MNLPLFRFAEKQRSKIDALVNNAGINMPRLLVDVAGEKPEYERNEEPFGRMFDINVKGVFLCAQACAPGIMEATGLRSPAYNEALAYTRGCKAEELSTDYSKVCLISSSIYPRSMIR